MGRTLTGVLLKESWEKRGAFFLVENTALRLKDEVELGGGCLLEMKEAAYVKLGGKRERSTLGMSHGVWLGESRECEVGHSGG